MTKRYILRMKSGTKAINKAYKPSLIVIKTKRSSPSSFVGIMSFHQGNNYLVTGATGFLAKVLIEKILRTVPDVGTIFLMINGKDKDCVQRRLKTEVIHEELFRCLKEIHGKSYEEFMMSKLSLVAGNICEDNLGMDSDTADEIAGQVHVIVNSAAATTFDERYDIALNTNTKGPSRLLDFANKCKNLKLFLHVSTAFVSGEREGLIMEKPICLKEIVAKERLNTSGSVSVPPLNVNAEIKLAFHTMKSLENDHKVDKKIKDLGIQRAKLYGWPNTYSFTKAMGEILINSKIKNVKVPVIIIRPSIIESTFLEPFPGWIKGYRVLEPVFISYGKGQLPGFPGDPNTILDIVPADMVVNAILAAIAKHGNSSKAQLGELHVYHLTSSVSNPISCRDIFYFAFHHFTRIPMFNPQATKIGIKKFKFFSSSHTLSSYLMDQTQEDYMKKRIERFLNMAKLYEHYGFYQGRFDDSNTQKLIEEMSSEEKKSFGFDVKSIQWQHYIENIHLPGIRRHILHEKPAWQLPNFDYPVS